MSSKSLIGKLLITHTQKHSSVSPGAIFLEGGYTRGKGSETSRVMEVWGYHAEYIEIDNNWHEDLSK